MAYYYKYNFISPEGIYSTVKEELKSYFDTGAIDDLMFSTYLDKCLRKLGKGTYNITQDVLYIENYEARLPDNFHAVREAWLCTETDLLPYQEANSFYSQSASTTIQISPMIVDGTSCGGTCTNDECDNTCQPEVIQAVYKTNAQGARSYKRMYLLKPGNISAKSNCDVSYTSLWDTYDAYNVNQNIPGSSGYDSFDIRGNKFLTNFRVGVVYLVFYGFEYDEHSNQMIPDDYRIKEYIEKFIKFKMFETLCNQVNDETFNQLLQKKQEAKQEADEAFIMAEIQMKSQTVDQKIRAIRQRLQSFNMYELPNRSNRNKWRIG